MSTPRLSRKTGLVLACVALVALGALLWVRARSTAAPNASEAAPAASPTASAKVVAAVRATRRDLERTITLNSELRPYDSVNLYAKAAGYVRDINVDYGSRVTAGETIATLELPEQEADLQRARAAYELAKVDNDRVETVSHEEPGAIAAVDVDKAHADYKMAQDELNAAQVVLGYGAITVPFDGVITKRYVDPGALIAQGTTSTNASPIVQVSDLYRLRMIVEAPESIVSLISVGTPVTVKIQSTGQAFPGRVARFAYDLHQDTRTMHTEVDVNNANLEIKPGMFASVQIVLAQRRDVVTVPTQAVESEPSPNVWIVDGNDVLRERRVTLGLQTANYDEITSGLQPGERVYFGNRDAAAVGEHVVPRPGAAMHV